MPQTTLASALNGGIRLNRAPRPEPGPRVDPHRQHSSITLSSRTGVLDSRAREGDGRRWGGGVAEQSVLAAFKARRREIVDVLQL